MFEPVVKAKLSGREFATLVGVSFPAACNWLAGRSKPHAMLRPKVTRALKFIETLYAKDKLPLPADLSSDERREKMLKLNAMLESYKG